MPNKKSKKNDKVWIVVTVDTNGECDMYADVIGVFTTEKVAEDIAGMIRRGENPAGMDIENLSPFETATVLEFPLDETIKNA